MSFDVYIDGENFVHRLCDILIKQKVIKNRTDLKKFDIVGFLEAVLDKTDLNILYYTTQLRVIKTDKELQKFSEKMVKWNAYWAAWLTSQGVKYIKSGNLKVRDSHRCRKCGNVDKVFQEKGVDVRLATDIVIASLNQKSSSIALLSSDTDLLPAVKSSINSGGKITYIAYENQVSRGLVAEVSSLKTFSNEEIIDSYKKANKK